MRKPIARGISPSNDTTVLENQKAADQKNAPADQAKSTRGAEGKEKGRERKEREREKSVRNQRCEKPKKSK